MKHQCNRKGVLLRTEDARLQMNNSFHVLLKQKKKIIIINCNCCAVHKMFKVCRTHVFSIGTGGVDTSMRFRPQAILFTLPVKG